MPASSGHSYSSGSDKDPKAPIAKPRAKLIRDEGAKPIVPSNERRVTFAELVKRKAEDDDKDARQRTKDRIRRKIQRVEEKRQFLDGVPSDSNADAAEEETAWDVTNSHDSDSKEEDSEKDSDENSEKDSDDESDNSDGSDE
ncbi:ribosomal L1 domain-containing protein CG13096-like [Papaver somniferum]|uniref:ribosomal L1 domain-containing protein CG13096-like n=1 Tax=Papaver somniferum TaxID=3469 RepID=UPI000E6F6AB0|nr:ribosomal L1 domain-containing protein CG13096-like [Papaver somniferum]